jgi:hypothetical protein
VVVVEFVFFQHGSGNGIATTTQFQAISLNGFGIFAAIPYGHIHIAIPICIVSVGAIYNLNIEG